MREARNDKRAEPTMNPNSHYWGDMFFKHFKQLAAFVILVTIIILLVLCDYTNREDVLESIKSIAWLSAGFLFGSAVK